jgi:hypothetical protein
MGKEIEKKYTHFPAVYYDAARTKFMNATSLGLKVFIQLLHQTQTQWDRKSPFIEINYDYFMRDILKATGEWMRTHKPSEVVADLHVLLKKVAETSLSVETPEYFEVANIWQGARVYKETGTIRLYPTQIAAELVDAVVFARIVKDEIMQLTNKRAPKLYLLLSDFRNTGNYYVNWETLANYLNEPEKGKKPLIDRYIDKHHSHDDVKVYKWAMIEKRVLDPLVKELKKDFKRLKYTRTKSTFHFTFTPS